MIHWFPKVGLFILLTLAVGNLNMLAALGSGPSARDAVVVLGHSTCKATDPTGSACIEPTDVFSSIDERVVSWVKVSVLGQHKLVRQWVDPTGEIYATQESRTIGYNASQSVWWSAPSIHIYGYGAAGFLGNWSVRIFADNQFLLSDNFTIRQPAIFLESSANGVKIDGKWENGEWDDATSFSLYPVWFSTKGSITPLEGAAQVRYKRDSNNLYVLCDFLSVDRPHAENRCATYWKIAQLEDEGVVQIVIVKDPGGNLTLVKRGPYQKAPPPFFDNVKAAFSVTRTPTNSTPHLVIEVSLPLQMLSFGASNLDRFQVYARLLHPFRDGLIQFWLGWERHPVRQILPVEATIISHTLSFKFDVSKSGYVHADLRVRSDTIAGTAWNIYNFTLPGTNYQNLTASDARGPLKLNTMYKSNYTEIEVMFRTPVGYGYEFTLSLDVLNAVLKDLEGTHFGFSWLELTREFVEVSLPEDAAKVSVRGSDVKGFTFSFQSLPRVTVHFTNELPTVAIPRPYAFSWSVNWVQKETHGATTSSSTTSMRSITALGLFRFGGPVFWVGVAALGAGILIVVFLRRRRH